MESLPSETGKPVVPSRLLPKGAYNRHENRVSGCSEPVTQDADDMRSMHASGIRGHGLTRLAFRPCGIIAEEREIITGYLLKVHAGFRMVYPKQVYDTLGTGVGHESETRECEQL